MQATAKCRNCGSEIGAGAPFGHCAKCLLALGFTDEAGEESEAASESEWRIGDYEVLGQVGRGGMGAVYRARQIGLNREVALKVILPADSTHADAIKRFQIEAEAAAKLHHPNIVPIYEIGRQGTQRYFTMQLIEGANLDQCLATYQLPSAASITGKAEARKIQMRIARLLCKLARAVHFAHQQGILHRDIKPQNILIDASGEPFLTDFGLAKILDGDESITERMALLGTLNYMAPEQAAGVRVGRAADLFSLGAVLYQILAGAPPFRGVTPAETLRLIADKEPVRPQDLNRWVDPELAVICLKCLQKNPHERYASAGELADDLNRWLRDESIVARPASRMVRARRWVRRNRVLSGLVVTVVAAAALGAWDLFDWWRARAVRKEFAITIERRYDDLARGLIANIVISSAELAAATGKRITPDPNARRLKVGIYTESDQLLTIEQLAPFLHRIESKMARQLSSPIQVELYLYGKREPLEGAFLEGLIDVVRVGEGPLVRLRRRDPEIQPIVRQVSGGKTSVVFVTASSPITSLEGLKGASFAAGNPTSTSSGYKLFEAFLNAGLSVRDLEPHFQDNAENNPRLVADGEFEAAVVRKERIRGSLTNHFRILKEFPTTTMPWAARAKIDPATARAFTASLAGMKDRKILANLPDDASQGFKPADARYFEWLDHHMQEIEERFFGGGGIEAYLKAR